MAERRYALSRIEAGAYAVVSNDGRDLWLIHSYVEDGSLSDAEDHVITGKFWRAARVVGERSAQYGLRLIRDAGGLLLGWDLDAGESVLPAAWDAVANEYEGYRTRTAVLDAIVDRWESGR